MKFTVLLTADLEDGERLAGGDGISNGGSMAVIQELEIGQRCHLPAGQAAPPVVIKLGGSALENVGPALNEIIALWRAGWQPLGSGYKWWVC